MTVLSIDTSTIRGSVALLQDGAILFEENFTADRSHSSSLFSSLATVRKEFTQLDQIAIGLGPGSYAGVRIAISAAIGLSLATGAKLLGLPSFAALDVAEPQYVALGDARRETFYWSVVDEGVCREGPLLLTEAELSVRLAANQWPIFSSETLAIVPSARLAFPSAVRLAHLALAERGIVARDDLEPIYLREPHITQPKNSLKKL
jgi:tRNA threonylcarbamoyl adenosine modification protein YeaZ